jgi:DNA polymerase-1
MLHLPSALKEAGLKGLMLLQVHDELVLECPQAEINEPISVVCSVMENAFKLKVPLGTEARYGSNWSELTVVAG